MKIYGVFLTDKRNKWLNFGGYLDHHADYFIGIPAITMQIMSRFCEFLRIVFSDIRNNSLNL